MSQDFNTGFTRIYMPLHQKKNRGISLVEVMIVVAILGIMASQIVPKFSDQIRRSTEASTKGSLATLRSSLLIYFADNIGADPVTMESIVPKYISALPTAKIGTYHIDSSSPSNKLNYTTGLDVGGWLYVTPDGAVFVNCTHLDTHNERITTW